MYRATFEFRTSLKESEVYQRDEVLGKTSAMRGELRTPRSAVEYSETALTQEGGVGKPMDALGSDMRMREQRESMKTKKPMEPCKHGKNL